jgi:hypothetical protein
MQMYYLPSIPLLALSSMIDERLDDTFGEQTCNNLHLRQSR